MANTNEKDFFRELARMEKIQPTSPLSDDEILQIYEDVARNCKQPMQLFEFVRRIEYAHLIGIEHD